MTIENFSNILYENAFQRCGIVGTQKFGIDQGPFEESTKKYVAYLKGNYNGDFYFNTLEELFEGFYVNGKPIGEQIEKISKFYVLMS